MFSYLEEIRSFKLDSHALLFSLILVSALMSISLFVVARQNEQEGSHLWGYAMALITVAWILVDGRGSIPDLASILIANVLFSTAISLKLAAVHKYRQLDWPRLQCLAPIFATLILFSILPLKNDLHVHILTNSIIYTLQLVLLAYALYGDKLSRSGHAWRLLFGVTVTTIFIVSLRGIASSIGHIQFADVQSHITPNPVQIATYGFIMATITLGSLGFILMLKERSALAVQHLALTDSLTGVMNRRAFMNRATQELAFSKRWQTHLSLIMLDIDHFKSINDRYGHLVGDAVLTELVRLLETRLRAHDIIGRYGGEEFCILLPGTDDIGAHAVATSLLQVVESACLATSHGDITITISLGISVFDPSNDQGYPDFSSLLKSADIALYQAKREGRNRVIQNKKAPPDLVQARTPNHI